MDNSLTSMQQMILEMTGGALMQRFEAAHAGFKDQKKIVLGDDAMTDDYKPALDAYAL